MLPHAILNLIIINVIILGLIIFLYFLITKRKDGSQKETMEDPSKYTIAGITDYIKHTLNDITNSNLYDLGLSEEEFIRRRNKRDELKRALKNCNSGDINDKTYVKEFIFDLLYKTYGLNNQTINLVIPFDQPHQLTVQDRFEILVYLYKKRYRNKALKVMIEKNGLDQVKKIIEDGETESYIITEQEIHNIYKKEVKTTLSFEDKLSIVVQRVYQEYKGFGVIDEIRDMDIDGVSGGVSGLPSNVNGIESELGGYGHLAQSNPGHFNNIWLFYKGKTIHLSFLSFKSEYELKRVCQNIYKYNNPGQLSEAKGYIVNEMKDGSRVVVVRPPFAESWAFFVRKFDLQNTTLEQLITDKNCHLPISLIKFLMKGAQITAVTGQQGSGKTTLVMAMVKYIYAFYTLRIQELAFELHLRRIHPERNILSLKETDTISGQEGLDVQKKTDGSVNILGEVATDPVAAWMIQMGQVASLFTIFTHHAKTFKDLIFSLRNSLLKTRVFSNERIAEQQVVSVIKFDIHLKRNSEGHRYIERITECIPLELSEPFSKTFEARNILEYHDGRYILVHPISESNTREILDHLSAKDKEQFLQFIRENWGENHVT